MVAENKQLAKLNKHPNRKQVNVKHSKIRQEVETAMVKVFMDNRELMDRLENK